MINQCYCTNLSDMNYTTSNKIYMHFTIQWRLFINNSNFLRNSTNVIFNWRSNQKLQEERSTIRTQKETIRMGKLRLLTASLGFYGLNVRLKKYCNVCVLKLKLPTQNNCPSGSITRHILSKRRSLSVAITIKHRKMDYLAIQTNCKKHNEKKNSPYGRQRQA